MKQLILLSTIALIIFSCDNPKKDFCLSKVKDKKELRADSLKQAGELKEAIPIYKEIYNNTPNVNTAYSLAYSYSLGGELDSSLLLSSEINK